MLPCSSLAILSASSINSVPNPLDRQHLRKKGTYGVPDVGTWLDRGHVQEQLSHKHGAREQCCILLLRYE